MTRAVILVVGDELLSGDRRDRNGLWLAQRFAARGVHLLGLHVVGDDLDVLTRAVQAAAAEADLVVLSGGLGPTEDDMTREALAAAAGVELVHDEDAWQAIQDCLTSRDRVPGAAERRQALVPEGGRWLPNAVGVAPGLALEIAGARVFAFPGVPREWRSMIEAHVLGALESGVPAAEAVVWVAGVPEGEVARRLEGAASLAAVTTASYPHDGEVELRYRATGEDASARVAAAEAETRERLGADVFDPPEGGRIEHVVVRELAARGWRLASAESVTGGLIARMITRVPGATAVYPVGWITYATEQKTARVRVDEELIEAHGVVSAEVAAAMAEGARAEAGVDVAVATTGTAGPGPLYQRGRAPIPAGRVYVAMAMEGRATEVLELSLPHPREMVQRLASVRALDLVRRAIQSVEPGAR